MKTECPACHKRTMRTVIFDGYGLGRSCDNCGKQILDDNEDADGY